MMMAIRRQPPSIGTCVVVYYAVLVVVALIIGWPDPVKGLLTVLLFTHIFLVLAPTMPNGEIGVLVLLATVIGLPLCAVALKGWWRVVIFIGLLLAANLHRVYVAFHLADSA